MPNNLIKYKDPGTKLTEERLAKLERKIGRVYQGAAKDIGETIEKYWADFIVRDEAMRKALDNGTYPELYGVNKGMKPEEHYKAWRMNQVGRGERMMAMQTELAKRIYDANKVARAYISDYTPGIYSLNWNYSAYTINAIHKGASMILYDEQTIKRLIMKSPNLMPYYSPVKALKRGIDLRYSRKVITNTITQQILTGKSLKHAAKELEKTLVMRHEGASLRAARTAFTSAQNGGRMACMESAAGMGIDINKQWMATMDNRTRDSHMEFDGDIVPIDVPFRHGNVALMYPGDTSVDLPGELYNCRCTLVYVVDGVQTYKKNNLLDTGDFVDYMDENGIKERRLF